MNGPSIDDAETGATGIRAATVRRIVTGRDALGRSIVVSDGPAVRQASFTTVPGLRLAEMWSTQPQEPLDRAQSDPTIAQTSFVPVIGGSMFRVFEEPPDQPGDLPGGASMAEFLAEAKQVVPGLGESLEVEIPGMHTTESIDYVVVLRGRGALELDDGVRVEIGPGDCIVQTGTRHRWLNTGDEPLVAVAVMIGVRR